jgi:excisionase family DNA binding protein
VTDIQPALFDVKMAGAYLALSRARIYELVGEGTLTAHKVSPGKTLFKRTELDRFIRDLPEARIGRPA